MISRRDVTEFTPDVSKAFIISYVGATTFMILGGVLFSPLTQPVLSGVQWIRQIFTGLLVALGTLFVEAYYPITSQLFDNQKEVTMFERDEFNAFLVGFVVGGLSGAVVGLLFAPQSGEETRTLIKDKSVELGDKAQVSAKEAIARAETTTAEYADELAHWLRARGQGVVGAVPEPGKSTMDAARSKAKKSGETSETTAV